MIALYDAHSHCRDEAQLAELHKLGLIGCVVNGTSEKDWPDVERLANRFDWIIPSFGLHPWHLAERSGNWFDALRRFLDANPRACMGEIGLDRWMKDLDVADQEEVFAQQLQLANERNLPASIHCLKAWGPMQAALTPGRYLIHSYSGSAELVPVFAKRGCYFSISRYFEQERKAAQREVFKQVPLDRFLIETDAPDMAAPNEIGPTYEFAARLRETSAENLAAQVELNFKRLFLNAA